MYVYVYVVSREESEKLARASSACNASIKLWTRIIFRRRVNAHGRLSESVAFAIGTELNMRDLDEHAYYPVLTCFGCCFLEK